MREILDHHDGYELTQAIKLVAIDDPGPGGANHEYEAFCATEKEPVPEGAKFLCINFQRGPRSDPTSSPGVVDPVLLAIVLDRLRAFQNGPYRCRENALAITKIEEALHWLKHRADERARRGVLGTVEK